MTHKNYYCIITQKQGKYGFLSAFTDDDNQKRPSLTTLDERSVTGRNRLLHQALGNADPKQLTLAVVPDDRGDVVTRGQHQVDHWLRSDWHVAENLPPATLIGKVIDETDQLVVNVTIRVEPVEGTNEVQTQSPLNLGLEDDSTNRCTTKKRDVSGGQDALVRQRPVVRPNVGVDGVLKVNTSLGVDIPVDIVDQMDHLIEVLLSSTVYHQVLDVLALPRKEHRFLLSR